MLYISTKFREIISNGIKVMDRTQMFNRWLTDGRMDRRTDTQKFGGYKNCERSWFHKLYTITCDEPTDRRMDGQTDRQMDRQGQILMPPDYRHGGIKKKIPIVK